MPASNAARDEQVIVIFASLGFGACGCDWPLSRIKNEGTIGEIRFGFAPLVNPVGSGVGIGFRFELRTARNLLAVAAVAEPALFGAIDLDDDTMLNNDVH